MCQVGSNLAHRQSGGGNPAADYGPLRYTRAKLRIDPRPNCETPAPHSNTKSPFNRENVNAEAPPFRGHIYVMHGSNFAGNLT